MPSTAAVALPDAQGQLLRQGADQLGLSLTAVQTSRLLDYLALLVKWNSVYNLTSIRDPQAMLVAHLLDSLAIVPTLQGLNVKHVLDVGSGGGLPGIPIAICMPTVRVSLVDAVQKKVAFLTQAKGALQLTNVHPVHQRVEALTLAESVDCITSRAFSDLSDWVRLASPLLAPGGCFVGMKGVVPNDEIARLPEPWAVSEIVPLSVPGLDAERCLIVIRSRK